MSGPDILAVSFYFPPLAGPQAVQVSRLLGAMDAHVTVIAGATADEARDDSIAPEIDARMNAVFRIKHARSSIRRKLDYLGRRARLALADVPDEKRAWARGACGFVLSARNRPPDALITFGQPMSDHLFGLDFKQRAHVPWIAHFSDPWVDNPYRRDNPATARLNAQLERRVMQAADALVFTSPETVDLVMRKYDQSIRAKAHVLPHCYDRELFEGFDESAADPGPGEQGGPYVIRSIGSFYGERSPVPFYQALEAVAQTSPALLHEVSVEFYGYTETRLKGLIDKYPAAKKCIAFKGTVPYMESLRLCRDAHCLLVVDAPSDTSVFFPSKLVDYLGAGRYIFAVPPGGATRRIVTRAQGAAPPLDDPAAVAAALSELLKNRPRTLSQPCEEYDKHTVAAQMMDIVSRVMG